MPSAAGEGEDGATEITATETPVGTLSALLDGTSDAPVATEASPAPAETPAPAPVVDEQQSLDDSIHEQMGFEF